MKASHPWEFDHSAELGPLDPAGLWSIARQGQVAPGRVVVLEVPSQDSAEVDLIEHDDMIEAFPAERADQPFRVRILPRGPRCRDHVLDAQHLD